MINKGNYIFSRTILKRRYSGDSNKVVMKEVIEYVVIPAFDLVSAEKEIESFNYRKHHRFKYDIQLTNELANKENLLKHRILDYN